MSIFEKLAKTGIKSEALETSEVYSERAVTSIDMAPIVNIALSGDIDGGLGSGVGILAGPSKHFKSNTGLLMVSSFMNKHKDAVCLFYDSEFGSPPTYWKNFGIDISRVIHIPIENLEDLKFDLPQKLQEISRKDKVIIFVDSIGNLASKKEATDAIDGKSTTDMTRAREMKSMFRIATPMIKLRNIPAIFVAHTYQTMEMFSKAVISGGTGPMYSADWAIIFGKQQEKDNAKELVGYNFIMNIEKSRFIREKSKIPLTVLFEGGINYYSGILDLAIEANLVKEGKYSRSLGYALVDPETGEIGEMVPFKKTQTEEFLGKVMKSNEFKKFVKERYQLVGGPLPDDQDVDVDDIYDEDDV